MKSKLIQCGLAFVLTCGFFSITNAADQVTVTAVGNTVPGVVNVIVPTVVVPAGTNTGSNTMVPVNQVVGTSTCANLMTSFNKFGDENGEVAKLQNFLNAKFGTKLNGKGFYGPVTKSLVQDLQYTYGINPTGNQYEKTTKLVNEINCGVVAVKTLKNFVPKTIATSIPSNIIPTPVKVAPPVVNANPVVKTPDSNTIVKDYANTNKKIPSVEGKPTSNIKIATDTASKTNFFENLKKDWSRIQENYKAYLLVFALVLALFWFLRKAATE
jgi:uncharacterized protein (DUF697 family)